LGYGFDVVEARLAAAVRGAGDGPEPPRDPCLPNG
jgi:hypothetical protein